MLTSDIHTCTEADVGGVGLGDALAFFFGGREKAVGSRDDEGRWLGVG